MMKTLVRLGRCLWISALVALCVAPTAPTANANGPDYAGLVVDFGGRVETRCVSLSGSISGIEALRQHFSLETAFGGGAVCKIGDTGCPGGDASCWCQCPNPNEDCRFWSYWHRDDGDWHFSDAGAPIYQVRNGDVEGWKWAEQSFEDPDSEPADRSFEQICAEYLVTDTPVPTNTPIPTDTPPPTATPVPTNTPQPTETPTATSVPDPAITFSISPGQIEAGQCATLGWKVDNAKAIYLDGQGVTGEESRQVCPSLGTYTYRLHVVGQDDRELDKQMTLNVIESVTAAMAAASAETPSTIPPPDSSRDGAQSPPDVTVAEENNAPPQPIATPPQPAGPAQPESEPTPASGGTTPLGAATVTASNQSALAMNQAEPTTAPPAQQPHAVSSPAQPAANPAPAELPSDDDTLRDLLTSKVTWFILLGSTAIGVAGLGGLAFVGSIIVLLVIYRRFSTSVPDVDDGDFFHDDYDRGG